MAELQKTVYLSVAGDATEVLYRAIAELLERMRYQIIDVGTVSRFVPVVDVLEAKYVKSIRQCSVFIGVFGGDTTNAVTSSNVEYGPSALEVEFSAATAVGVPKLLYASESLLDSDSWLARFVRVVSGNQLVKVFTHDEELLTWLQHDLVLLTRQQQETPAGRSSETDGNDSKIPEQKSEEEGYNEHFDPARDQVAQLYERANRLLAENNLNDAAELYGEIIGIQPSELEAYGRLRDLLEKLGRTEEARQVAAGLEELFPVRESADSSAARSNLESPAEAQSPGTATGSPSRDSVPSASSAAEIPLESSVVALSSAGVRSGAKQSRKRPARSTDSRLLEFPRIGRVAQEASAERDSASPKSTAPPGSGAKPALEGPVTPRSSRASGVAASTTSSNRSDPVTPPSRTPGDQFSSATLRAFAVAEALRLSLNHRLVLLRAILLLGLIESPTGLAGLVLSSLGISREAMLELLDQKLSGSSKRTIGLKGLVFTAEEILKLRNNAHLQLPRLSDSLRIALSAAESIAAEQHVNEVQPDHIFVALIRSLKKQPGWIGWMLGEEKTEWIQKTLADWPNGTFTEESLRDKAIAAGLYSPASASSDAAAKDDLLNFKQSASAMVNIVLKHDTVPPLVVGVYGPWGSGKSTYLELVKKGLLAEYDKLRTASDGSKAINLLVVEYDAWAYSDAPKLWAGLITKIAKKLDEDLGWWGRIKYLFKTHRARLVGGVLLGLIPIILAVPVALLGKPLWAGLGAAAGPLISVVSAWLAQRQAVSRNVRSLASKFDSAPASGVINSIQDEFRDALESWIKQKTGADAPDATIEERVRDNNLKIVVFIDELDRCPLERIVDILEAIKLFLAKEIFIVFMAVDTRVASEAIRLHYKDVRNPDLPREYLEKIVQLPLRVPTAKGQHLSAYLKKFMPNVKDDEPGVPTGAARAVHPGGGSSTVVPGSALPAKPVGAQPGAFAGRIPKIRAKEFADPSPTFLLPQLPDTKTELNMLATISERFLESNPRKIKRLLNTYRYIKVLAHAQAEPVQSPEWQQTMLGWLAFTMTWPSFMAKAIEKIEELEPKNEGVLLRAIVQSPSFGARPSEADVSTYLPVSGERIKALWELAGNFLIENADPGSVSHSDAQVDTRTKSPA